MIKFKISAPLSNSMTMEEVDNILEYFKNVDYKEENPGNSGNLLLKAMMDIGGGTFLAYSEYKAIKPDTLLYRTRAFNNIKEIDFRDIQSFYSPPKKYANWGRINKPNEPVLYASFNQMTAIKENTSIERDFFLIKYRVASILETRLIGKLMNTPLLNEKSRDHELFNFLNDFVENLMLEKKQTEEYYIFTNGIIEQVLFGEKKDGYYYKSAVVENEYNLALDTDVEENKIKLYEVWHFRKIKKSIKCIKRLI